jgi:hypothetical protein
VIAATTSPFEIFFLLYLVVLLPLPAFIVGRRRGVSRAGIAFVPYFGAWIVIFRSIGRSGWLALLLAVPLVGAILAIWAAFTVPSEHGRTKWWALPFVIPLVNLAAFWVYAFTLEANREPAALVPA